MPSFLVETYLAQGQAGERAARDLRARAAAEELTRERTPVRFERSIHLPSDEICFFVFDAPSSRQAALVAEHARLDPVRVVEIRGGNSSDPSESSANATRPPSSGSWPDRQ